MRASNILWIKSIGFTLLSLLGMALLLYALTESVWRAGLALLLAFLISRLNRTSSDYAAMARQHRVVEIMEDKNK